MYEDKYSIRSSKFSTPSKQMSDGKTHPKVKTVSVLIQNIDDHLAQSYKKLKQRKQRLLYQQKSTNCFNQDDKSMDPLNSITKISITSHHFPKNESRASEYGAQRQKLNEQKDQIVLLNNQQVMNYVNYVYETYKIPDPFQKYKNCYREQTSYQTQKKEISHNREFKKYLESAQTLKNTAKYSSLQLSPFITEEKREIGHSTESKYKFQPFIKLKQGNDSIKQHLNPSSKIKRKGQHEMNLSKEYCSGSQISLINQMYRYCFMCEQPILQCNLVAHEEICAPLKQAYQFNLNNIIQLLDTKINRLVGEIEDDLMKKRQNQISEQFRQIKESVRNWMEQLPPQSLTQRYKPLENTNNRYNAHWRSQFLKIEQNINKSVCKSFESIKKLNWFAKLRENIAKQFYHYL